MNPRKPSSLGGVERLYKAAKVVIPELERTEVERFLEGKFAYSQHKQIKRKFTRRPVIATSFKWIWLIRKSSVNRTIVSSIYWQ